MQMKRLLSILGLLIPFKAVATTLEDKASLSFEYYADNTDVQVYSPSLSFLKKLTRKFLIGIKMRIDAITAASIRKGGSPAISDAVTGATVRRTYDDIRYAPSVFGVYDDGDNSLTIGTYYSTERDYTGRAVFFNYVRQLNLQNTAFGIAVSQSSDIWNPVFNRNLPRNDRKERKIDLSITQLLSPTAMVQAAYSNMFSEGFLGSPYHYLIKRNIARFELLPQIRKGHAVSFRFVKLITTPTSINVFYRYYTDDWGISSHTGDVKVFMDVTSSLTLGLRYRYYNQTKANFAKAVDEYKLDDKYVVVDYRFYTLSSNTLGAMFIQDFKAYRIRLKGAINYYQTSPSEYIQNWYGKDRITSFFGNLALEYAF